MYDINTLLSTIAACSATIVAIVGGFIVSRLISVNTEREEIQIKLSETNGEIEYKENRINELKSELDASSAEDFIEDHIAELIEEKPIELIFEQNPKPGYNINDIKPYWEYALVTLSKLYTEISSESLKLNEDGVPVELAKELSKEDYYICKLIVRELNRQVGTFNCASLGISNRNSPSYNKRSSEVTILKESIKWLSLQKEQLTIRSKILQKPKGMLGGLVIFAGFSLVGIILPLILIPFPEIEDYNFLLIYKAAVIGLFALGLLFVFLYLISFLKITHKR